MMSVSSRLSACMFALLIVVCCAVSPSSGVNELLLFALPVGQGDCTVIVCPKEENEDGNVIIVDMGSSQIYWTALDVQEFLKLPGINGDKPLIDRVKTIILTHGDQDHYSYFLNVFRNDKGVTLSKPNDLNLFLGGSSEEYTKLPTNFWDYELFDGGRECRGDECTKGTKFKKQLCGTNSDAEFEILAANTGATAEGNGKVTNIGKKKNSKSVVLRVKHAGESALLCGDLEGEGMTKLTTDHEQKKLDLRSDYLKMPHHGAYTGKASDDFMEKVSPKIAFASAYWAGRNRYRHPRCDTLTALAKLGNIKTATKHEVDCGNTENGHSRMTLERAIYTTMPQNNHVGYIFAVKMGGDNSSPLRYPHKEDISDFVEGGLGSQRQKRPRDA